MKNRYLFYLPFILSFLIFNLSLKAQDFDSFKKQHEQAFNDYKDKQVSQLKALQNEFDEFVKKRDKEFGNYLKQQWKEFETFKGIEPPKEPKPLIPPSIKPDKEKTRKSIPEKILSLPPRKIVIEPPYAHKPIIPRIKKTEPDKFPMQEIHFNFYGSNVFLKCDKYLIYKFSGPFNETGYSNYWNTMCNGNYCHLIDQLFLFRNQMNLNDWAYYEMINAFTSVIHEDQTSANLFTWFLLIKSGFNARIGYENDKVFLMLPSLNEIYRLKYIHKNGLKHYIPDASVEKVNTYEKDFSDAPRPFDLNLYRPVLLGNNIKQRKLSFPYHDGIIDLKIDYCRNVIDFYNNYPHADFKIYFDAMVSPEAKESLANSLYPYIKDMNDEEAVQFLLTFIQKAFPYKTDEEQFGKEKYFFPEESLHYPYNDCEDRSVLFAYLVKSLLGLKVIGLHFPGHMATAVLFPDGAKGNYVLYNNQKFTICDPTYIGANIGMSMPKYKTTEVKIIELNNTFNQAKREREIWEKIFSAGGSRGDLQHDLVFNQKEKPFFREIFTKS